MGRGSEIRFPNTESIAKGFLKKIIKQINLIYFGGEGTERGRARENPK